ncbi:MAG: DUF885 domain-containing protein [Candidatus Zixiibacteriota bacterium]
MIRILSLSVISVIFFMSSIAVAAPKLTAEEQLQAIAEDFLSLQFEFDPVYATEMGEHKLDARYPDFSSGAVNRMVNKLRQTKTNLKKIKVADLGADAKLDYTLLESNIDTQIITLTNTNLYRDNPKLISSTAVNGIYFIMLSQSMTEEERLKLILERLVKLPDFLTASEKQLKNPPQIWTLLAKEEADNATTFLGDVSAFYGAQLPQHQKEIDVKFAAAVAAFQDFSDFLGDFGEREGQSFAIGREVYNRLLTTEYFLDFDVDSLTRIGESLLDQYQKSYDSLSAIVDALPPIEELNTFIPATFSRDDVIDYFQWEIDQTRKWVSQNEFATVPADIGECQPVETPKFLENIIGGIAYQAPGAFESVQTGRFYVRPLPDSLDDANRSAFFRYCYRRGFRSSVVHEAYPGHHMQLQLANRSTSLIRRIQRNNLMIEGWTLYCEEAMYDQGFYGSDPRQMLAIIGGIRFRAARIIVDTKLQTGQMTYQQAIDWMVEKLGASVEYIEKEVNRYTLTPTTPMTYLLGKEQIKMVRSSLQSRMGEQYSAKRFHDLLLNEGAIPPMLILRKVNDLIL